MESRESAEMIALKALGWFMTDSDRAQAFLGTTGASPGDLAALAGEAQFLGAVLDTLLGDEAWVMDFCRENGLPFTAPMAARAALPGGDLPHWT